MTALLCTICVFLLMVLLLRCKMHIAYVLLLAAAVMPFVFWIGTDLFWRAPLGPARTILGAVLDKRFLLSSLNLLGMVLLITTLGNFLKHSGKLASLIRGLTDMLRDNRLVMAVTPAAIGLLPMPGGALLSAPMVGEIARDSPVSPERKSAVNYWFRHIWEYCWPLYPGLLFIIHQLGRAEVVKVQYPLTLAAILGGLVFMLRQIPREDARHPPKRAWVRDFLGVLDALWPVAVVVTIALVPFENFQFPVFRWLHQFKQHLLVRFDDPGARPVSFVMVTTLLVIVAGLLLAHRRLDRKRILAESITLKLTLLIAGMTLLGQMIEVCGAAEGIRLFFEEQNIPGLPVLFVLPFVVGLITGYTAAYVSIAFPLFAQLLYPDARLAFAFAGGFLGVLLSPVHLCLILTREYFQANLGKIYRLLVLPALTVALVAVLILAAGGGL